MNKKKTNLTLTLLRESPIKAAEVLLSALMSFKSRSYCLDENCEVKQIYNHCTSFRKFEKAYGHLAKKRFLVGVFTKSKEDIKKTEELVKNIVKYIKSLDVCDAAIGEVLAKVLAYRNLEKDDLIKLPCIQDGKMHFFSYQVDKVFNLWNSMKCFGLSADKAPPILLFRGTDFSLATQGSRTSILSNFDPQGPGRAIFRHATKTLSKWLETHPLPARAIGFSLGAALASYSIICMPKLFSKTHKSYLFHPPGVGQDLCELWATLEEKPLHSCYVAQGDFVSKYGKLFDKTFELIIEGSPPPIASHSSLFFIKEKLSIAEIDIEKENIGQSRKLYSNFHKTSSKLVYEAGIKHFLPDEDLPPKST